MGTTSAQKKLFFNLKKIKNQLAPNNSGDLKTEHVEEISKRLNIKKEEIISMDRRLQGKEKSLNDPIKDEDGTEWQDWIIDNRTNHEIVLSEKQELNQRKNLMNKAMDVLNLREKEILSSIPYQKNIALLHTDTSVLPLRKRVWASWNSNIPRNKDNRVSLTYNMNMLQSIKCPDTICVSLNMEERIKPEKVLKRIIYNHPVYNKTTVNAQNRKHEINGLNNTYYAGAYWKYGFHEDGVKSALDVCRRFGVESI